MPNVSPVGLLVNCPAAATPVPDKGIVSVGFVASDVKVTLPLEAAAVCGAKVTVKVVVFPAANVLGVVIPLKLNPVPLMLACEMVTLLPPVFVMVAVTVCCVPTVTLPRASLEGLLASCPAVTPVPVREMVSVGFDASDANVTVPLAEPADCGAKVTVKLVL